MYVSPLYVSSVRIARRPELTGIEQDLFRVQADRVFRKVRGHTQHSRQIDHVQRSSCPAIGVRRAGREDDAFPARYADDLAGVREKVLAVTPHHIWRRSGRREESWSIQQLELDSAMIEQTVKYPPSRRFVGPA